MARLVPGMHVSVRYYGSGHTVNLISGTIDELDHLGIVILPNSEQGQYFPWTSVQRVVFSVANDNVS